MGMRRKNFKIQEIIEHLRETHALDMIAKAYRCRFGNELDDSGYEHFAEQLIVELKCWLG